MKFSSIRAGINRRDALRWTGAIGGAAALTASVPYIVNRVQGSSAGDNKSQLPDTLIPARRNSQRLAELPDRVLDHLNALKQLPGVSGVEEFGEFEHSLQSATLAFRAGRKEEYVICALLHDIGTNLGSYNHGNLAASLLEPFVTEQNRWMVEQHSIFRGYYYFESWGLDRNMREKFRGHPYFEPTAEFCELFDRPAVDPAGETLPLEAFEPMVRRVFTNPKRSLFLQPEIGS